MVGLERLKGAPYAETNDFLFLIEGEGKPVDNLVFPGVGIIRKDQAKRYVQDGNLDPNLHANTRTVVAQFGEKALRQVSLRCSSEFTTQEHLLKAKRKNRARVEGINLVRCPVPGCDHSIIAHDQTKNYR